MFVQQAVTETFQNITNYLYSILIKIIQLVFLLVSQLKNCKIRFVLLISLKFKSLKIKATLLYVQEASTNIETVIPIDLLLF